MVQALKQIFREFWLPFVLASVWTAYVSLSGTNTPRTATIIMTFSTAFFLISWASGQFIRVRRQAKTETSLNSVESRLAFLTHDLEQASTRFVASVTGGDSFAYLVITDIGPNVRSFMAVHVGDFTLSNVHARVCDLNSFQANIASGKPFSSDLHITIGEIITQSVSSTTVHFQLDTESQDFNVFFSARNGFWMQALRGRLIGSDWKFATIVTRQVGPVNQIIFSHIPQEFPLIGEEQFDNAEREPPNVSE